MLVTLKRAGCGLALLALKMTNQIDKKDWPWTWYMATQIIGNK